MSNLKIIDTFKIDHKNYSLSKKYDRNKKSETNEIEEIFKTTNISDLDSFYSLEDIKKMYFLMANKRPRGSNKIDLIKEVKSMVS